METVKASASKALEAKNKMRSGDAYNNFLGYKKNTLNSLLSGMKPGLDVSFMLHFYVHCILQIVRANWRAKIGAGDRFDTLLGDMAVMTDSGDRMFVAGSKEVRIYEKA